MVEQHFVGVSDAPAISNWIQGIQNCAYRIENATNIITAWTACRKGRVLNAKKFKEFRQRCIADRRNGEGLARGPEVAVERRVGAVYGAQRSARPEQVLCIHEGTLDDLASYLWLWLVDRGDVFLKSEIHCDETYKRASNLADHRGNVGKGVCIIAFGLHGSDIVILLKRHGRMQYGEFIRKVVGGFGYLEGNRGQQASCALLVPL